MSGTLYNPTIANLFYIGLSIAAIFMFVLLIPKWINGFKKFEEAKFKVSSLVSSFGVPFVLSFVGIFAVWSLWAGSADNTGNFSYEGDNAKPRPEFTDVIKADEEAVKPQTRKELEAERAEKQETKKLKEARAVKMKAAKAAEGLMDFRNNFPALKSDKSAGNKPATNKENN